jgi:hypothetical protein
MPKIVTLRRPEPLWLITVGQYLDGDIRILFKVKRLVTRVIFLT